MKRLDSRNSTRPIDRKPNTGSKKNSSKRVAFSTHSTNSFSSSQPLIDITIYHPKPINQQPIRPASHLAVPNELSAVYQQSKPPALCMQRIQCTRLHPLFALRSPTSLSVHLSSDRNTCHSISRIFATSVLDFHASPLLHQVRLMTSNAQPSLDPRLSPAHASSETHHAIQKFPMQQVSFQQPTEATLLPTTCLFFTL